MPDTQRITSGLTRAADQSGRMVSRAGAQLASAESTSSPPASAAPAAETTDSTAEDAAADEPGVLARVGEGFAKLIELEQQVSAPLHVIPMPGFPALRITDTDVGLPHAHNHPPNLTPPNPVPIPLPSTGPVLSLPLVSGATRTMIEYQPAARCGDLGLGMFCGGFFPMYEVFFGSSNVWIEGARQARMGVDLTKHCLFSTPKPSDPPMGPMFGSTVSGASRTVVGGVPMPSLTAFGLGLAFKGAFKGAGAVTSRVRARFAVNRFLEKSLICGDGTFKKAVRNDLNRIARTAKGRQILDDIQRSGHGVEFASPQDSWAAKEAFEEYGPHCADLTGDGHVNVVPDPDGRYLVKYDDGSELMSSISGNGKGSSSQIVYDPQAWDASMSQHPGTPRDVMVAHELNHARNNAMGEAKGGLRDPDPSWNKDWKNHEEAATVKAENEYRAERGGVPDRPNYAVLP